MTGGLLDRDTSRWDPKRGQREVAGGLSVPDSDGMVFEVAGHRVSRGSKNKEGLKFNEQEALKEAIVIFLASASVQKQSCSCSASSRCGHGDTTKAKMPWMRDDLRVQAVPLSVRVRRPRCPSSRWAPCVSARSVRAGLYCTNSCWERASGRDHPSDCRRCKCPSAEFFRGILFSFQRRKL